MSDETTSPQMSPRPTKSDGTMTFGTCLEKLMLGERCRRLSWEGESKGWYIVIKDEKLMIFRTDDKVLHPLTVSVGDITGMDWVIVGKQESLS